MDLPDYSGGSIVNLMASLQVGLSGEKHAYPPLRQLSPDEVGRHRQVILWIIDGLGYDYLTAHADALYLNAALKGRMTSVYPPTTASAITTFLTGEAPQQHGITGWFVYFRELGSILSVLPGRARYGGSGYGAGGIDVAKLLAHRAFADRIGVASYSLSPAYIVDSEFNRAHLGPSTPIGFNNLQEMCDKTLELSRRSGRRFISLYWPELDTIGHHAGIWSEQAVSHLRQLDQIFQRLCEGLQGSDTLLLVCADHGQIDSSPEQTLLLDDYPELQRSLVLPLCGEPRSAYCYLRPGCEQLFDETVSNRFQSLASLYSSSVLIEQEWFGLGTPHSRLAERIGDRVLLMQERAILKDRLAQEKPIQMIGMHGGLSKEELWVPLVIADC
jgi:predicted AlkP superfamily pyrophosphatase or phosphodiesterase